MKALLTKAGINLWDGTKATGQSLVTWAWVRHLLKWAMLSAGTMAEGVFLIGALWLSLNSSIHQFVLLFVSEPMSVHLSWLATSAFIGLPEFISPMATMTTIDRIKMMILKPSFASVSWVILFGIPAVIFVGLSLITIGFSVAQVGFILPLPLVIARALAGYIFAFAGILYAASGVPQERDRLAKKDSEREALRVEKDAKIAELIANASQEKAELIANASAKQTELEKVIATFKTELENHKTLLAEIKNEKSQLLNTLNKYSEGALGAYSEACIKWLKSGVKSVSVEEINLYTGHSKKRIVNAIESGRLKTSTRNKALILVPSLWEWLENNPPMEKDTRPDLRVVNGS